MQERRNSNALAMELRIFCINPSISCMPQGGVSLHITSHVSITKRFTTHSDEFSRHLIFVDIPLLLMLRQFFCQKLDEWHTSMKQGRHLTNSDSNYTADLSTWILQSRIDELKNTHLGSSPRVAECPQGPSSNHG